MEAIIAKLKSQKAALAAELGRIDAAIAVLSGGTTSATAAKPRKATGRKRRKMIAAEKRAGSQRMKKSWAERKRKAASQ